MFFFLQLGADVNASDSCGDTALHWACFCGHVDAAKALVAAGADSTIRSTDGKTPTDAAKVCLMGCLKVLIWVV